MAEALKMMFDSGFIDDLCAALSHKHPPLDGRALRECVYDEQWPERELKARIRHISACLRCALPEDYRDALSILRQAAPLLDCYDYQTMIFPDFVEAYGLNEREASLAALEQFTQQSSAEFAVRPFIEQDRPYMMARMLQWTAHKSAHLRRLASEGCRPRLPWASSLPDFKRDPSPILPILEQLRDDDSDYVRRSVANNLNDIAKDHPQRVIDLLAEWQRDAGPQRQWIIRHALRTLVKAGHPDALALMGYEAGVALEVSTAQVRPDPVRIGEAITFRWQIRSQSQQPQSLLIDYVLHFMKASGQTAPKVFKLTQRHLLPGETLVIEKTHSFRLINTRRYYPGQHMVSLKINGTATETQPFMLIP